MREHENLPDAAGKSGQLQKLRGIKKGHEQMGTEAQERKAGVSWFLTAAFVLICALYPRTPRLSMYFNCLLIVSVGLCYLSSLRSSRCWMTECERCLRTIIIVLVSHYPGDCLSPSQGA